MPGGVGSGLQMQSIPPAVQALAALLSNSKLSQSDVTHLQSLAESKHTGNLGQLAAQLEMAIQLAQSTSQSQAQNLPEPTHRIQIPAAHLTDRSAARVASVAPRPSGASTMAPGATAAAHLHEASEAASKSQASRADKAAAELLPQEPLSALDLVAEAAAAEETSEHTELLM